MEPVSEWRLIEPEGEPEQRGSVSQPASETERLPRGLIAAIVAVVSGAVALAIWATLPAGGAAVESSNAPFDPRVVAEVARTPGASAVVAGGGPDLVVDVEGAVNDPGLHELPDGSRVGDAISAAGGYAPSVDIAAATQALNLAAKLTDGQQIHVPALGEKTVAANTPAPPAGSGPATATGLIDINHATAEELDTLPGIGPVTAAKIIDARTQAPFASVDELESRGVVGASTFEKLRDLVTVTP